MSVPNDVMAQFGFGVADEGAEERMKGLATQLRGDRDLGQFFQFSGNEQVRGAGQNMIDTAQSSIDTIGNRRQQGLTRSRQKLRDAEADRKSQYAEDRDATQDAIKAEALEYARKGWTNVEEKIDADGKVALYGLKDGRGPLMKIPGSDNLKDRDKYAGRSKGTGKGSKIQLPGTDAVIWKHPDGRIDGPKGEDFKNFAEFAAAYPKFAAVEAAYNSAMAAGQEEWAKGGSEEARAAATALNEQTSGLGRTAQQLDTMVSAIDSGAMSGPVSDWAPTVRESSALLESTIEGLTLDALTQYKLTPVSDKDLAALRKMAAPNLYPQQRRAWALHKKESVQRMQKANQIAEDYIRQNGSIPYGEARKDLEAEIEEVLHGDGFDFTFKLNDAGPLRSKANEVDTSTKVYELTDGTKVYADGSLAE